MDEIKSVLINLGYTKGEIEENIGHLNDISVKTGDMEEKVREALKIMKRV